MRNLEYVGVLKAVGGIHLSCSVHDMVLARTSIVRVETLCRLISEKFSFLKMQHINSIMQGCYKLLRR